MNYEPKVYQLIEQKEKKRVQFVKKYHRSVI